MISENIKLQETLDQMGFETPEEASQAFDEAEKKAKEAGLDTNVGTLALCGRVSAGALLTMHGMICTTLFNAYSVTALGTGITLIADVEVSAIYFRFEKKDQKNGCFHGVRLGVAFGSSYGIEGAREYDCRFDYSEPDYIGRRKRVYNHLDGFFVALELGYGIGIDLQENDLMVTHLTSYWN